MTRSPAQDLTDDVPEAAETPRADSAEFSMGLLGELLNFRLRRIRNRLAEKYRAETLRVNQRAGAFSVLALIDANPGIAQIDLARFSGYDQTVLVDILNDMDKQGWITRTRDPADRRRHQVLITDIGREALTELFAAAQENERDAREALTPEELQVFRVWLDRIYRKLI